MAYRDSLDSDHLRLLRPVSLSHGKLHFSVITVRRAAVQYHNPSEIICLDGQPFPVRPNLWSCLYYLGLASRHTEWEYLWIDAICINQANDAERNSQVRCMDQTYRSATCVSVWLGLIPLPEGLPRNTLAPIKTLESDGFDWRESMLELASRPYWTRFWVIQECLLGLEVELYCSDNRIRWFDFQHILCTEADVNDKAGSYPALPLIMSRTIDRYPELMQPLYDLLVAHHRAECKETRDRVFALLGLVKPEERRMLGRFFPDYAMAEEHVLIITLAHLTQYRFELAYRDRQPITPDSEEIFLGLGVKSKTRRRALLRRAKWLDYCDWDTQLPQLLTLRDQEEQDLGSAYLEEAEEETEVFEDASVRPGGAQAMIFLLFALAVAVVWYAFRL
ncbi:heterokaryon incompatibility protein-domain-containing protein [Colletotrichum godetiae]|uniref:Heterokaryon incompatibility protein-domain-containing protein n=1 Tax=Colletotrichum godetiae TaxID=1209918 RepID=A0AAJ0A845_9PEZI|nr:heterokaryon incompatibility protein-domain-containing protein [Colletotrichum godetiae]KAK1657638.1 heterokaryon incompatibility protein-domain-containing protein [Colletotrichum godetiae]